MFLGFCMKEIVENYGDEFDVLNDIVDFVRQKPKLLDDEIMGIIPKRETVGDINTLKPIFSIKMLSMKGYDDMYQGGKNYD
jgi:hypothetical protein